MQIISRYVILIISLLILPWISYSSSDELKAEFRDNFLHLSINIPENHRIYVKGAGSVDIDLAESRNLQKYDVILPKPQNDNNHRYYTNNIDIKVSLSAWDEEFPIDIRGKVLYQICNIEGCEKIAHDIDIKDCQLRDSYLFEILLIAVIGGFILNFMPCVLPVLSLKILSILKSKSNLKNELSFSILGIFTVFWILAAFSASLKAMGSSFGIGFHFQEPLFILFLTSLMTIFVSKIMTGVDFQVPSFLSKMSFKNSYLNSFISGILAALFSTPCTAPFLGTAIAFAATSSIITIFVVFSFIALGFSLPYIVLIVRPSLLGYLPKPGKWMENLKLILAVLMIITIFWLLTILYAQLGFRATFGSLLILMLIKFVSDQNIKTIWKNISYIILLICLFNLPQMAHREDYQKAEEIKEIWSEFTQQNLKKATEEGKIIVIDITADWCGTCKYNKYMVWNRQHTIDLLTNPRIMALRKDVTVRSIETQRFMQSIGVYGIPFNIIFGPEAPNGIVLPTILSYHDLKNALEKAGL